MSVRYRVIGLAIATMMAGMPMAGVADTGEGDKPAEAGNPGFQARTPEPSLEGGTAARPLNPTVPKYPREAAMRWQEGWVLLNFVVQPDGTVSDPVVEDSSGTPAFEKAALQAISTTRYKPATWNGKPIQQCATQFRYIFAMENQEPGARPHFVRQMRKIRELAEAQKTVEAEAQLAALIDKGTSLNYEAARAWLMQASFQAGRGDTAGAVSSLQRATVSGGAYLENEVYRLALVELIRLQAKLGRYSDVLETYKSVSTLIPPLEHAGVEQVVGQINAAVQSSEVLGFPGIVEYRSGCEEGRPNWKHQLLRRKFAFDSIDGKVEDFQLRCDWRLVSGKVSTDKIWEVPRSWGYCQVFVFGDVGAKVKLLEYPSTAASPK